jgi:hypothetical protein
VTSHLTNPEAEFVYNAEVLGLPVKKAAQLAGLTYAQAQQAHIKQAREQMRKELVGELRVSKEDSARGILGAIERAVQLAEPATEIMGWKEINQMYGHNAPQKVDINLRESVTVVQHRVKSLPDAELVKLLGAGNVIDGEFYEAKE